MISVITLTYKRHEILQEAINSFILQDVEDCEMIVLNDAVDVTYTLELTDDQKQVMNSRNNVIRIVNIKDRFPSIMEKLKHGFYLAKNKYLYRLDDDDLLTEFSLRDTIKEISLDPNADIYRSKSHYLFTNNKYQDRSSSINNGNVYTKKYIDSISEWQHESFGEDNWLTFHNNAKIKEYEPVSMIYRWGMDTYHISGMGDIRQEEMFERVDKNMKEEGSISLKPSFKVDYYKQIRNSDHKAAV